MMEKVCLTVIFLLYQVVKKQRLLLSMAKVSDKPIIIKSGLCRGQMINMIDILQQMVPNEKIIIIVTHDYELIKNCKGKIIEFV